MSTVIDMPISDEILAAYLDGCLNQEQSENVERAIESSPELQWIVDRWIEEQIGSFAPSDVKIQESVRAVAASPRPPKRFWAVAAAILVLVSVSLPLLFNMSNTDSISGLPMDYPANRYESETSNNRSPVVPSNTAVNNEGGFSYQYEIYKTAAIITWNQSLDSARCDVFSNNRQHHFSTSVNGFNASGYRIFVVPLGAFNQSEFPIKLVLRFVASDFVSTDSISVSL